MLGVEVVGRTDGDAVEIGLLAQQVAKVVVFGNALVEAGAGSSVAAVRRIGVGEPGDFHVVALLVGPGVADAATAGADEGDLMRRHPVLLWRPG